MDDPRSLKPLSNQPARRRGFPARLLDWFLPMHCVLCRREGWPTGLCDGCVSDLPRLGAACRICASELPSPGVCGACLGRAPAFDETVAVFRYGAPVDRLIHALKYGHDLAVARALGHHMATRSQCLSFDCMIPVPLHRRRLAERGFNQSIELARETAHLHRRRIDAGCVRRVIETPPQAGLNLKERRRNLRHAFDVSGRLDGQRVLVIDDVMTSGATLDRLAQSLKQAGAARVINLVCARTPSGR